MDNVRNFLKKPWAWTLIAGVAGILVGMVVFGWYLFPVQWTDATPEFLRKDLKSDYLRMTFDSYTVNKNAALAKTRWDSVGKDANKLFSDLQLDTKNVNAGDLAAFAKAVNAQLPAGLTSDEGTTVQGSGGVTTLPIVGETPKKTGSSSILPVALSLFCVLTLVLGFVVFYVFVKKGKLPSLKRKQDFVSGSAPSREYEEETTGKGPDFFRSSGESPVSQFMTTYMQGDEQYDDSFSIDNPMGEFMGECGVGISETIGVGDPKKVAAFEVWLFDKNDIQTVTKVLMSEHTFGDPAVQQRLMSKGEPILAEPGKRILLETATLQLEARIVDMNYGQGPLPPNSYFDRLTLELAVWPKPKA